MAAGKLLIDFHPYQGHPSSTADAWHAAVNKHPVMVYPGNADASFRFRGIMPGNQYGPTGVLEFKVHYSMATDTSGTIEWEFQIARIGDEILDLDVNPSWTSAQGVVDTVPATAGHVTVASLDNHGFNNIQPGDSFILNVERDVSDGTAVGDAYLHWVEIFES